MDRKLLWWIFAVTKGGIVRARIVHHLRERPMNANQLAQELKLDYTTVRYHLNILLKNGIVVPSKDTYIVMYFLSDAMEEGYEEFLRIYEKIKGDRDGGE
ncbi:MAG: winged helix-turn-helix domain-containing protein [Candidatus Hydrothermarchaeota archaeon]